MSGGIENMYAGLIGVAVFVGLAYLGARIALWWNAR
jgi:hypothetical protein